MVKQVKYDEHIIDVMDNLTKGGIFLTTKDKKTDTMVIGWGGVNIYWGKPVFIVAVRKSRYTHSQIENTNEFTVSVPSGDGLRKQLAFCGSKSGRDYDKFKECGLTEVAGQKVNTPVIGECKLHYECKVVYKQDMIPENLDKVLNDRFYPDYHTFYFGEIVSCYLTE